MRCCLVQRPRPECSRALAPCPRPADYALTLRGLDGEELEEAKRGCHQRGANRLLDVCFKNGGIYIKLGQHIGMLVRVCARRVGGATCRRAKAVERSIRHDQRQLQGGRGSTPACWQCMPVHEGKV